MGKSEDDIVRGLRQMMKGNDLTFPAVVTDNYPDKDYCDVTDLNGTLFPEVRKRAAVDSGKGMVVTPVNNSTVIVSRIQESDSLFINMVSEIESIKWTLNNHVLLFDKDGWSSDMSSGKFDLKNNTTSLNKLFASVYDIISKLTVSTPNGPSGTPLPPTITALEKFKTEFQNLLK